MRAFHWVNLLKLPLLLTIMLVATTAIGQEQAPVAGLVLGPYEYEVKPDDPAFEKLNPRKAPQPPNELILQQGDRLAICGDSITEQKMYSRLIETYLTVCVPELKVQVRQYGWSGEKTDGFLRRMEQDCLTFDPTIATLCYGMNDARYRPFDITNGLWYDDHYTAIVRRFKESGVRVVVGSPGPSGKLATWVKSRSGTLDEHNQHLCALRDIAIGISLREQVGFADMFWPMAQAQAFADREYSTPSQKYEVTGHDGIHPGWAGHTMMAYAFLRSLGLDGDLGSIDVDLGKRTAVGKDGHVVDDFDGQRLKVTSRRYPFCADGPIDRDDSIRSGMTLIPFNADLNRFTLRVRGVASDNARVTWGGKERTFSAVDLEAGVNLAAAFIQNPFCEAFDAVDEAVAAKQAYETKQVKSAFHSTQGRDSFELTVRRTEAERQPLVDEIQARFEPLSHELLIEPLE